MVGVDFLVNTVNPLMKYICWFCSNTRFSECSRAYLEMLRALGRDYSLIYNVGECLQVDPHSDEVCSTTGVKWTYGEQLLINTLSTLKNLIRKLRVNKD